MKSLMPVIAIFLSAYGVVQAATTTIYSEDFSAATLIDDPVVDGGLLYYPGDFTAGQYASIAGVTLVNANNQLVVKANENGGARAVTTVIDSSSFIGAGTYTLSFDYVSAYNFINLDVQIWNADGATSANPFYVDVVLAQGADAEVAKDAASTAVLTPLSQNNEYPKVDVGNGKTINFTYDGSGDVILAFTAQDTRASGGFQQQLAIDNVEITTTITPSVPSVRLIILDK